MTTKTTKRMRVVVEMTGSDPFRLGDQAQRYCDEEMVGEEMAESESECAALADDLLRGFLATIDPDTTGADRLSVAIVID